MSTNRPTRKRTGQAARKALAIAASLLVAALAPRASAQEAPYRALENWAQLPQGWEWGQVVAVDRDEHGNVYVFHRCGSDTCVGRSEPPLLRFDSSGRFTHSWGAGMFVWPHGLHVDHDGFVWATDAREADGRGHQVFKFSADGALLMTLGTAGVAGETDNAFNGPTDVVVAPGGAIFIADGHGNNRIVKLSPEGRFIKAWGRRGSAPGEFDVPHSLAMDSRGRLFVGDRDNGRIQLFDQDGRFLEEWTQLGAPSGVYIGGDDVLYVAHALGIAIARSADGVPIASIHHASAGAEAGNIEDVTADRDGNIYAALADPRTLQKLARR